MFADSKQPPKTLIVPDRGFRLANIISVFAKLFWVAENCGQND